MPEQGIPFSAVLLAGGASRRMGRDKAALPFAGGALRDRQLALLRALGPAKLFLSGASEIEEVETVHDLTPGMGPLGGIASALARMTMGRLLVLAVDLPLMTSACLRRIIAFGPGVIPISEDRFEPLAAVYPREALPIAQEMLARGSLRLQAFAATLVEQGLAIPYPIPQEERVCFENANTPEEWAAIQRLAGGDSSK